MHAPLSRPTHTHRAHRAIPAYSLEDRAPALINLPISLPEIPIISPIVTLLVAGINQQEGTSTVTTTSTISVLTTSPTESSTSAASTSAESSGNSNTSGSTDSSSDSSNSSSSSSGSPDSVSDVDDISDSAGNGSSGSGSTVSSASSGVSLASTGSTTSGSGSVSETMISETVSGNVIGATSVVASTSDGSSVNAFIFTSSAISSSGTGSIEGIDFLSPTHSSGTVTSSETTASTRANSQSVPSATDTATGIQGLSASTIGSQPTPNLNILSGNPTAGSTASSVSTHAVNGGTDGTEGTGRNSSNGNGGGGLPTGATVVISLIVPAIFAASLLFFIRQRFRAKRNKRNQSWFSNMMSRNGDNGASGSGAEATAGARSIRSSFGTSYEYNATSSASVDVPVPALPPMAEIRNTHSPGLLSSGRQSPPFPPNPDNLPQPDMCGVSMYSSRSTSSELYRQYLGMGTDDREPTTPMSVRPSMFVVPQSSQESSSETRPRRDSSVLGSSCEANPFVDPPADHPPPISFSDVEIIRRPFSPTLHDEMSVSAGDRVHVVRMFDDGWALVEKVLAGSPSHDGKGKQVLPQAGLIPIDCLREIWQPLEAFLQDNDVSRYSGTGVAI